MTRLYISKHQRDWDTYIGVLPYAYNTAVNYRTGTIPFELVLS